jgi:hypothetical protein
MRAVSQTFMAPMWRTSSGFKFGPGAVGVGWDGAVLGLTLHLSDPAALPEREAVRRLADIR